VTNEQPELDKIIGALRSAANASEMAGEDAALDAMASTLAATPTTVRSIGSPRSLRVVAVVAASLIGMGGIAAAGAGTFRPADDRGEIRGTDTVVDTTIPDTTIPDTTIPDTVVDTTIPDTVVDTTIPGPETTVANLLAEPLVDEPLLDEPLVDDPATEFDETQCAEGNHGATVSSIARETPPGPGHGDAVSIAAQSSCGKNAAPDDDTDVTVPVTTVPLVDDPATEFDETQCAEGNHGATVSSIAKQTPPGPGHGDAVSIAAQSSCGKDAAPDDDATDDVDDDATVVTVAGTADDDDSPGNGNGNANGNANSNGNGRGNGKPGG
jgi:hypothetical protein